MIKKIALREKIPSFDDDDDDDADGNNKIIPYVLYKIKKASSSSSRNVIFFFSSFSSFSFSLYSSISIIFSSLILPLLFDTKSCF